MGDDPKDERKDAIAALSRSKQAAENGDPRRARANAEAAVALLEVYESEWEAKQVAKQSRRTQNHK